jgi:hypothetical protein
MIRRFEFDLSQERRDYEVKVQTKNLYVERCDGEVYIKINNHLNDRLLLKPDMKLNTQYLIDKIYISNTSSTGSLVLIAYDKMEIKT